MIKPAIGALPLIRDAEVERFLYNLSNPIFKAANLNSKDIKIYIVNDDSLNAFVSGGQNVFINTGLILKYKTPDTLIGVIAHETGHIAAGHLARASEGAEAAEGAMILSYLLGIGAALGGSPDAAQGLIMGGSQTAQKLYMKFTRNQEEAADKHAVVYLDKLSYPASGLVELLEFFESEMIGYKGQIDEYLLSHPVSRKRIDLIKNLTAGKNFSDKKINEKLQESMNYVLAKLEGFMGNPHSLIEKYQDKDDKFSNYKKSLAYFRLGNVKQSIALLDQIIFDEKSNIFLGFLYEMKGQILFETGDIENSILAYDKAIKLLDNQDSALAKISFATAILSLKKEDRDLLKLAIRKLEEAQKFDEENPYLFKQLALAYSKIGDEGMSLLSLAEFNLLIGKKDRVRDFAQSAKKELSKYRKTQLLRADDLLELAKEDDKEKK